MIDDDLVGLLEESASYYELADEPTDEGEYYKTGWYAGKAAGNLVGGTGGAVYGGWLALEAAEPVYQAVEATTPEAGPVVRLAGYSIPAAQVAVSGILAHEGGRIGLSIGKHVGKYWSGILSAGLGATLQELGCTDEFLDEDSQ